MKVNELIKKSQEELEVLLEEKRQKQEEMGRLLHQKKIKNVKELWAIKKDIARILTILKSYEAS
ncbi:MAG: 50S ribosomal protein L29 [Candidatus Sungiibacteriota bacterium]|uniref:Large ribosomal subunit protein uL29 n=1 Tax=Candidatus Sungiibacteriota bacterium TaxID=2750080 RepID=A0A7T5UQC1_9BACT|nr:MAG: 50S ribosomal protein L29 [Candidatus Sungbacteria bacterium]